MKVRILLIALLGAASYCGGPLDPLVCHTEDPLGRTACPWCGESCRYS